MAIKKLIEVALPLEAINTESAREKSIRFGHPSTLHLWWARRPLATARAVIWSSLVDDPSSHPELFPTEAEQNVERNRLFGILSELVKWENSNNSAILEVALNEINKYTDNNPPALLDPFAGGGTIPLEAQRLGLKSYAHDLNPVAVMINKALIEIPPVFNGKSPVNPDFCGNELLKSQTFYRSNGLAEDIQFYGKWLKREAYKKIGHLYPKLRLPDQNNSEATVIAWIWARTVNCPNPACCHEVPLARTFELSKKKGNIAWIDVKLIDNKTQFSVIHEGKPSIDGTIKRTGAKCPFCNATIDFPYIRNYAKTNGFNSRLMAIVADGPKGRFFISPTKEHEEIAKVEKPTNYPEGELAYYPGHLNTNIYGLNEFHKLFTNRQLTALLTYSQLLKEAQREIENDALNAGFLNDNIHLCDGGKGALAYSEAVIVYLSFGISRMANSDNSLCRWTVDKTQVIPVFSRQALPMVWDYAENNVFNNAAGDIEVALNNIAKVVERIQSDKQEGQARQFDAQSDNGLRNIMVSTDPPYYDNIGYADLSDFFYIWLRRNLKETYPKLFRTLLVPKTEELIATPYRHEGNSEEAKAFFEDGMLKTCQQIFLYSREDIPVTIYYAYKQNEIDDNESVASSGWETMLSSIVKAGFSITGTWPVRTEMANRAISMGANALASSIVLVCRKRDKDAPIITRRNFVNELKRELRPALRKLQQSNLAPVDLAQSAIGPGMGVFSKYREVLDADGTPMTVRGALQIINQELDVYFNEQDGELDRDSRFCVDLYSQYAFNDIKFGDADTLARAKNTSVANLEAKGILFAQKGIVRLVERIELPEHVNPAENVIWLLTQQLTHAMETGGISACANIISPLYGSNAEFAKDLAYRLYTIAERKGWTQEAFAYNSLVIAWPDIISAAAELRNRITQMTIDDIVLGGNNNE